MTQSQGIEFLKGIEKFGLGVPVALLCLLAMMILPIPAVILDLLFTFNIALSILVLLAGIYSLRPLDFAVFPTVLLIATLLRLALNIASTRIVLLNGSLGPDAAGEVIKAFGEVVIGGNYAVGLVVFTILVIINFVVVTKGAGRISEVSARFTLDAMPGKQMAIDADLNAGTLTQEEARQRREEVTQEADFYGSMDGASKFVRGDAIAGILILFINIIGGMAIGIFQHDLPFFEAARVYALLTIGDGLVAQIPALILSVAAAIMVTRVSRAEDMSHQVLKQVFSTPRPLMVSGGILIGLGIIPGMPHLAFLLLGGIGSGMGYFLLNKESIITKFNKGKVKTEKELTAEMANADAALKPVENKDLSWEDVPSIDLIGLEIGYRLIGLVDKAQAGELMGRIKGVRKKLSQELGFLIPSVHIRDNLELNPNTYRVSLLGVTVGEALIYPEKDLAINPGQVFGKVEGIATKDPAFGLEAIWIEKTLKEQAQTLGFTVVDASTVIATHLSQLINEHAAKLIGHEEVQKLLENLSKHAPKLVEDLVPKVLPLSVVVKVLQNLLTEKVPIRDMRTIAETLTEVAPKSQDPNLLTAAVRIRIAPMIVQQINGMSPELPVITLSPSLEQILHKTVQGHQDETMSIEPGLAERLHHSLKESNERQEVSGLPAVLLVSAALRPLMARFVRHLIPGMSVLSYSEIPQDKQIKIVSSIGENR